MVTFLLVRHGESVANKNEMFAGHLDVKLSDRGNEQAKETAKYIYNNYNVDMVYTSDLQRAYLTGKCVADLFGLDVIVDKDLREIYAGEWEGKKFLDLKCKYKEDYNLWLSDIGVAKCTGGETVAQLSKRIINMLEKLALENDNKTIVIATHGTPLKAIQCLVQTGDLNNMKNIPWVRNASVSVLNYQNNNWTFSEIGYDAHLGELKGNKLVNV